MTNTLVHLFNGLVILTLHLVNINTLPVYDDCFLTTLMEILGPARVALVRVDSE